MKNMREEEGVLGGGGKEGGIGGGGELGVGVGREERRRRRGLKRGGGLER